ncbi:MULTISPECIES: WxL protein peptidoglycan domain-containing protein [unclassified Kribbella]|uniref:WxL protein peptidoglycan domain-containing protein n=1 Tax=unclassified Kribbella TaxID=2644121 RepID=UPI00301A4F54
MFKALVAAVVLLSALTATPAAADDDVPWSVSTAANSFGSERQNYSYTVNPGGQVEDGLMVVNRGRTPLELAVYAADAYTTDNGRLDLLTPDTKSTGVGAWAHADRASVKVAPGQSVQVPFTIDVPADAKPGDHLGGIVTSLKQGTDVDRRLAIRIQLRVSGDLQPGLSVDDLKVHYKGHSDATVTYTVRNTGNAILAARPSTAVSGPFGKWRVESDQQASPQLLPGESWKVSTDIHGVTPALRVTGTVTLLPLLTDAAGSTGSLTPLTATAHAWTTPWWLFLILTVVLVAVVLLVRRRRAKVAP